MANTTNFSVEKPTVGGYRNSWGGTINTGLDKLTELLALALPIGSIQMYARSIAPTATTNGGTWLVCDGTALIQDNYPDLYALIGVTYGNGGNAATHFNLPDLRARVPVGFNAATIDNSTVNERSIREIAATTGGTEGHILTEPQLAAHSHAIPATTHDHDIDPVTHVHTGDATGNPGMTGTVELSITDPGHTHSHLVHHDWATGTYYDLGIEQADEPSITKTSSSETTGIEIAAHAHPLTTTAENHGITTTEPEVIGITSTAPDTGSNTSHNNMQPYVVVNYIILVKHPSF
jgi:microcystin-dependent protein